MLRIALFALAVVVLGLLVLTFLPEAEQAVPDATISLSGTRITLYPEADPDAVWTFVAAAAHYDPNTRDTRLLEIDEGERRVGGELDFTIRSPEMVIDRQDNLMTDWMFVHLVEAEWDMVMQAGAGQRVRVDQRLGRFEVPVMDWTGAGLGDCNHAERVSMNFDLTDYRAGGEGTTSCNQFEDILSGG